MAVLGQRVQYGHDFRDGTTTFSIDDMSVRYPAWWVGDDTFEPLIPERDKEEDDFAYIAYVAKKTELQQVMIDSWSQ